MLVSSYLLTVEDHILCTMNYQFNVKKDDVNVKLEHTLDNIMRGTTTLVLFSYVVIMKITTFMEMTIICVK